MLFKKVHMLSFKNVMFLMLCFVQDGKVEQKWKWPLGRLQTTVTVQVQYSPYCGLKKSFVKLDIEFTLFRAR